MDRNNEQEECDDEFDEPDDEERMKLVSMEVIRWKFIKFKLDRILGANEIITQDAKFKLVNTYFALFLQAMEYHPYATSSMHKNLQQRVPESMLTELDKSNAEDILIIAVETLYSIKVYDWTMLNPVNFMLITMLEHGQ